MTEVLKHTKTQRGRPKDPEKTDQILKAAVKLFMDRGLKHTSMDAVAQEAGVSKQTLYSHFKGKDDLFRAVIRAKLETHDFTHTPFKSSGDLEADLNAIGRHLLDLMLDDESILLFRAVIAEGKNYKKTAELFYDQGPETILTQLASFFENHNIPDARFYAFSFVNMLEGEWYMKALIGLQNKPTQGEIKAHVSKVCKNFANMFLPRVP